MYSRENARHELATRKPVIEGYRRVSVEEDLFWHRSYLMQDLGISRHNEYTDDIEVALDFLEGGFSKSDKREKPFDMDKARAYIVEPGRWISHKGNMVTNWGVLSRPGYECEDASGQVYHTPDIEAALVFLQTGNVGKMERRYH